MSGDALIADVIRFFTSSYCTLVFFFFFFFNDTATTEIYTLSLHDALPICAAACRRRCPRPGGPPSPDRSEEQTSELQSLAYLVCRLLLEKKKKNIEHELFTSPTRCVHETIAHTISR